MCWRPPHYIVSKIWLFVDGIQETMQSKKEGENSKLEKMVTLLGTVENTTCHVPQAAFKKVFLFWIIRKSAEEGFESQKQHEPCSSCLSRHIWNMARLFSQALRWENCQWQELLVTRLKQGLCTATRRFNQAKQGWMWLLLWWMRWFFSKLNTSENFINTAILLPYEKISKSYYAHRTFIFCSGLCQFLVLYLL